MTAIYREHIPHEVTYETYVKEWHINYNRLSKVIFLPVTGITNALLVPFMPDPHGQIFNAIFFLTLTLCFGISRQTVKKTIVKVE
jgi:hypothetical protein